MTDRAWFSRLLRLAFGVLPFIS